MRNFEFVFTKILWIFVDVLPLSMPIKYRFNERMATEIAFKFLEYDIGETPFDMFINLFGRFDACELSLEQKAYVCSHALSTFMVDHGYELDIVNYDTEAADCHKRPFTPPGSPASPRSESSDSTSLPMMKCPKFYLPNNGYDNKRKKVPLSFAYYISASPFMQVGIVYAQGSPTLPIYPEGIVYVEKGELKVVRQDEKNKKIIPKLLQESAPEKKEPNTILKRLFPPVRSKSPSPPSSPVHKKQKQSADTG